MYNKIGFIIVIILIAAIVRSSLFIKSTPTPSQTTWWQFQSIDTMKYSRDLSREKLTDFSYDVILNNQVKDIADTGATHVAIATPYDEEFYPMLKRWVAAARQYKLKVWFRGNFSGWEGWFAYPKIDRAQHLQKTKEFVTKYKDIFEDGDVFTACPECENGGPGDPRHNGDIDGYRRFLIDEYKITERTFKKIDKKVASNFNSMNGDVAKVIMDKKTTEALDGIVTIDHYVVTPEQLVADVQLLATFSGGKIVLGEFGVPIPDLHGKMTEEAQAQWIKDTLNKLLTQDAVYGINYWTNVGSSTSLWNADGKPRKAVKVIQSVYKPITAKGVVKDRTGSSIDFAEIISSIRVYHTDDLGNFQIPIGGNSQRAIIKASGFFPETIDIKPSVKQVVVMERKSENLWFKLRKFLTDIASPSP